MKTHFSPRHSGGIPIIECYSFENHVDSYTCWTNEVTCQECLELLKKKPQTPETIQEKPMNYCFNESEFKLFTEFFQLSVIRNPTMSADLHAQVAFASIEQHEYEEEKNNV